MPASETSPKSWRDVLPVHPAADLFPMMSHDELKALGEDIKKNGLREPVVLFAEEGGGGIYREAEVILLDGRNRLDAMEAVGLTTIKEGRLSLMGRPGGYEIKYGVWKRAVTGFDPCAYVISANIHRRHLTPEQRRELIAKVLKAHPEKSDRQIAEMVKRDHKTVGSVRREQEDVGNIPHVSTRTDTKGREQPAHKPPPRRGESHVCWQCSVRDEVGKVEEHDDYPGYEDSGVWLHPACVADFEKNLAAERTEAKQRQAEGPTVIDDKATEILPPLLNSSSERARLQARMEELNAEIEQLAAENERLRSPTLNDLCEQIGTLLREAPRDGRMSAVEAIMKALDLNIHDWVSTMTIGVRKRKLSPPPEPTDPMEIPECLRRSPS